MGNIKVSDLTGARMAVEPYSVKLASERIKEGSLEQLKQNIHETKEYLKRNNPTDARLLNLEFHRIIAQASENPVLFTSCHMTYNIEGVGRSRVFYIRL